MPRRLPASWTIIVVPTTRRRTLHLQLPVAVLLAGAFLAGALGLWAALQVFRLAHDARKLAAAQAERDLLFRRTLRYDQELAALQQQAAAAEEELRRLRVLEAELRNLLEATSPPAQPEGIVPGGRGGPDVAPARGGAPTWQAPARGGSSASDGLTAYGGAHLGARLRSIHAEAQRQNQQLPALVQAAREHLELLAHLPKGRPVPGPVTDGYGWRNDPFGRGVMFHTGVDLAAPHGAPVRATGAGWVVWAGWKAGGYGNTVMVDHGYGYGTLYAHLDTVAVKVGQPVSRGTVVGTVGSTGHSTGPHVHYELYRGGELQDPERYLGP